MKLIEYKPAKSYREDLAGNKIKFRLKKINGKIECIDADKPWVHPDYEVKEKSSISDWALNCKTISEFFLHPNARIKTADPISNDELVSLRKKSYKSHIDSYQKFDGEIKEKTFSELIEIIKEAGPVPHATRGNSTDNLWWGKDLLGAERFSMEAWKEAIPKKVLNWVPKPPIIFGTAGETNDFFDMQREMQEMTMKLQSSTAKFLPDDYSELYYLSESPLQMADWMKRKKKTPLLNAHDFIWIDNMVDEVFKKHTSN